MTVGVAAAALGGVFAVAACSDDKIGIPDSGAVSAQACGQPAAGTFPQANCRIDEDNGAPTCHATSACMINEAQCGSKSTCLPMADNSGKDQLDFRIRRLNVLAPKALASTTVQTAVVDHGISLGAAQCGEKGDGSFTWLFHIDKTAGTMTTGGSPPTTDPFGGYCFADTTIQASNKHIKPITGKITFTGDTFKSEVVDSLIVPIFVMNDVSQLILLPLSGVSVQDVTISANGNCIGSFNYSALDDMCVESRTDCEKWHTAGALGGYITLEDADTVFVPQLNESLCALLTGDKDPMTEKCNRDGTAIKAKGDYCSTTKSAGGCMDSYWLTATFAAAAVKMKPASSDPLCMGASVGNDGGTDSGSDGGTDAPAD
jgi:hypothetical protein